MVNFQELILMKQNILEELAQYIDGLVQDCSNSSALAMELLPSCTKPSTHWHKTWHHQWWYWPSFLAIHTSHSNESCRLKMRINIHFTTTRGVVISCRARPQTRWRRGWKRGCTGAGRRWTAAEGSPALPSTTPGYRLHDGQNSPPHTWWNTTRN